MTEVPTASRQYYLAQSLFWGGYILLNLVFMSLWGQTSTLAIPIFLVLSILLMASSHGLRCLYQRFATNWSLLKTALNLAWLLPIMSLLAQYLLYVLITVGVRLLSVNTDGMPRGSVGVFIGYSMNVCIMLVLWSTFYLLRVELRKRRNAEIVQLQLQLALKDAELQFLRGQINSHFLFNALNNLRSLIREDAERARNGLNDLASLLRGLLHVDPARKVKLKDELEWVKGYLALEALQFETRLQTEFMIDESLLNQELPPLILQTLVENAIRHGIAARRDGGVVHISARKLNDQRWQLRVTNPLPEHVSAHAGNGIGLSNARQRLQLAYGDQARLSLEFGVQVIATVELPL
jgi:signal transduction histidine kinase